MGDVFKEQIVTKKPDMKTTALKVGTVVLALILSFLALSFLGQLGSIFAVAAAVAAYYVFGFFNVEYEYIFTNGELDIDIIYSKSRRKRVLSCDLKSIELMAHVDDTQQSPNFKIAEAVKDLSSGEKKENTYQFLTMHQGKRTKIIFEPNDKMIQAIGAVVSPRKFIRKKELSNA